MRVETNYADTLVSSQFTRTKPKQNTPRAKRKTVIKVELIPAYLAERLHSYLLLALQRTKLNTIINNTPAKHYKLVITDVSRQLITSDKITTICNKYKLESLNRK